MLKQKKIETFKGGRSVSLSAKIWSLLRRLSCDRKGGAPMWHEEEDRWWRGEQSMVGAPKRIRWWREEKRNKSVYFF